MGIEPGEMVLSRRSRALCGITSLLLFTFAGFHAAVAEEEHPLDIWISLGMQLTVAAFCISDLKMIGKPLPKLAEWLLFFTWPASAPILLLSAHWKRDTLRTLGAIMLAPAAYLWGAAAGVAILATLGR